MINGLGKCPLCWKQIQEMTPIDNVSLGRPAKSWVCHKDCKKIWLEQQETKP
jgi:hypothetical protein